MITLSDRDVEAIKAMIGMVKVGVFIGNDLHTKAVECGAIVTAAIEVEHKCAGRHSIYGRMMHAMHSARINARGASLEFRLGVNARSEFQDFIRSEVACGNTASAAPDAPPEFCGVPVLFITGDDATVRAFADEVRCVATFGGTSKRTPPAV